MEERHRLLQRLNGQDSYALTSLHALQSPASHIPGLAQSLMTPTSAFAAGATGLATDGRLSNLQELRARHLMDVPTASSILSKGSYGQAASSATENIFSSRHAAAIATGGLQASTSALPSLQDLNPSAAADAIASATAS